MVIHPPLHHHKRQHDHHQYIQASKTQDSTQYSTSLQDGRGLRDVGLVKFEKVRILQRLIQGKTFATHYCYLHKGLGDDGLTISDTNIAQLRPPPIKLQWQYDSTTSQSHTSYQHQTYTHPPLVPRLSEGYSLPVCCCLLLRLLMEELGSTQKVHCIGEPILIAYNVAVTGAEGKGEVVQLTLTINTQSYTYNAITWIILRSP